MNEKSNAIDEKSTGNSGKVKDVEGVTIERCTQMREGAKTKIQINRKLRVKNLCCNIFVVFLKRILENGLGGFQHLHICQSFSIEILLFQFLEGTLKIMFHLLSSTRMRPTAPVFVLCFIFVKAVDDKHRKEA